MCLISPRDCVPYGFRARHLHTFVRTMLRKPEEARFGLLDLLLGWEVEWCFVSGVDHVFPDQDQLPAGCEIVDSAAVVVGVDYGRRVGSKTDQILRHG